MPQISTHEFKRLPLRVHDFLAGVPLHDVWAIDLPSARSGITLDEFLRTASARSQVSCDCCENDRSGKGSLFTRSPIVRTLLNIRFFAGWLLGWDREPASTAWEAFGTRLTTADRSRSLAPAGTPEGLFRIVYRFENEQLLELINRTAHAAALSALVETANGYRFYFGVYVQNVGRFTPVYMALVDPFRKLIVYPSLLRSVRASWNQAFGTDLQRTPFHKNAAGSGQKQSDTRQTLRNSNGSQSRSANRCATKAGSSPSKRGCAANAVAFVRAGCSGPVIICAARQRTTVTGADLLRDPLEGLNSNVRTRGSMFTPNLQILPLAQRRLWEELRDTPRGFVLYGGTALALRLEHRHSEDFDFFSNKSFAPDVLRKAIPYLGDAEMSQFETNTLTAIVDRGAPVKVSFFGGLKLNRVEEPELAQDNGIQVASLLDVAATKLATIQQRAQARDYEDLAAIIGTGVSLSEILAAAAAVYGKEFNGALSLKALTYFADGDLPNLSPAIQKKLRTLASEVNLKQIPRVQARVGLTGEEGAQR